MIRLTSSFAHCLDMDGSNMNNQEINVFELTVHEDAEIFDMWSEERLDKLATDIKENGFDPRYPLTVSEIDGEWVLIDGRNRREACRRIDLIPPVYISTIDPKLAIARSNLQNHDQTQGQKAMRWAMLYPGEGKRGGDRKSNILSIFDSEPEGVSKIYVAKARYIWHKNPKLDSEKHPQLAKDVAAGLLTLTEAYDLTQRDVKRREEEEAIRQANAAKLADVRVRYPDLAALVDDERITLTDAVASSESRDLEAQKEAERLAFEAAEKERIAKEEAGRLQAEEDAKLAEEERKKREAARLAKEDFDRIQASVHQYLDQLINATCVAVNHTQLEQSKKHLDWDVFASRYHHKRVDAIRVLTALSNNLPVLIEILEVAP